MLTSKYSFLNIEKCDRATTYYQRDRLIIHVLTNEMQLTNSSVD
ncbi:hypothetical protein [Anabaena subtropica]|nr:hypothetical protein [Anabaena subtropica]